MRFVSANLYVGSKTKKADAEVLKGLDAFAYGLQEASFGDDEVKKVMLKDYYFFSANEGGRSGQEVPILLSRKATYLGDASYLVSNRVRPDNTGVAPDRFLTWARFEFGGTKYCVINIHPNAAVQNKTTGEPLSLKLARVREYVNAMRALNKEIKSHKAQGFTVVVMGDLNFRVKGASALWLWSPERVAKRNGLDFFNVGLDYILWDNADLIATKRNVVSKTKTGSDHDWLYVDLKRVKKS